MARARTHRLIPAIPVVPVVPVIPATVRPAVLLVCVALAGAAAACDRRPEANGGPRIESLHVDRVPYAPVPDLPASSVGVETRAEYFVWIESDDVLRLGKRAIPGTTDVSLDELLRGFWRLRGDSLGGRGAASPSSAPLVMASKTLPARRIVEVVIALWQHGGRIAVSAGLPGTAHEHPVRLIADQAGSRQAAGGAAITLGPTGLSLDVAGTPRVEFTACGSAPDTACLIAALDAAAETGVRTVVVKRVP